MNKEIESEMNENNFKEPLIEKEKNNSNLYPVNEREQNDSRINSNYMNLQNSAFKNLKTETKSEAANAFM